jgi:hypothetical protein
LWIINERSNNRGLKGFDTSEELCQNEAIIEILATNTCAFRHELTKRYCKQSKLIPQD